MMLMKVAKKSSKVYLANHIRQFNGITIIIIKCFSKIKLMKLNARCKLDNFFKISSLLLSDH